MDGFFDIKKGFKNSFGEYYPKNIRKHKRVRKRLNLKNIDINPRWVFYT